MAAKEKMILSKRARKQIVQAEAEGYFIIDVTSTSTNPFFRKFSPFYPHGHIPIPGMLGNYATSVEGVWQGLKVFEGEGVDHECFKNTTMRNMKRKHNCKGRGAVLGHQFGESVLGYVDARRQIYLPTYRYVLDHYLRDEQAMIREIAKTRNIAFVDYETNSDVDNVKKPLSHASIIIEYAEANHVLP